MPPCEDDFTPAAKTPRSRCESSFTCFADVRSAHTARSQWIDLPPAFRLEAHAHPFGVLSSHLSSSHPYPATSSSPPIHRAHNKFFDSLTLADRPKARLGRNSASTTSLVNLGHESEGDGGGISSGASAPAEHVVELQFEDDHIAHYAHYGYVVGRRRIMMARVAVLKSLLSSPVLPRAWEEQRQERPHLRL